MFWDKKAPFRDNFIHVTIIYHLFICEDGTEGAGIYIPEIDLPFGVLYP